VDLKVEFHGSREEKCDADGAGMRMTRRLEGYVVAGERTSQVGGPEFWRPSAKASLAYDECPLVDFPRRLQPQGGRRLWTWRGNPSEFTQSRDASAVENFISNHLHQPPIPLPLITTHRACPRTGNTAWRRLIRTPISQPEMAAAIVCPGCASSPPSSHLSLPFPLPYNIPQDPGK